VIASGQLHTPHCFTLEKKPWYIHWIGHWIGHRTGLDAVEKRKTSCLYQELNHNASGIQIIV
jgi:hypothetical protein